MPSEITDPPETSVAPLAAPAGAAPGARLLSRALSEADAIDLWVARWLRVPIKDLVRRYNCDSRRLYEVWWGQKFPRSRSKAQLVFQERFPGAASHTAFGYRRIPRGPETDPRQGGLFD